MSKGLSTFSRALAQAAQAAATATSPPLSTAPLNFTNPQQAFKAKSTTDIIRTILVFKACQQKWLVNNADTVLRTSKRIFGSTLVNFLVRNTFYKQFVAGEDAETIKPTLSNLKKHGISSILDYAAEDDVSAPQSATPKPTSRTPPHATVVARTYLYEGEDLCDKRMDIFIKSIEASKIADGHGFAAIKVTALGLPKLLERVSTSLISITNLFKAFDEDGNGLIDREEFERVYKRLFIDATAERMQQVFDYLDRDKDDKVDYIAFTKGVTVRDGAAIASRCKTQAAFAKAALDAQEVCLLDNAIRRVDTLAHLAAESGVRLMIDAEHSYFQPAIDAIATTLQSKHNKTMPIIYNTYQCYLKDTPNKLAVDLERSHREGYVFGCKLVRGAYTQLERQRAAKLGYPSPIWDTLQQTHDCYNTSVDTLLHQVKHHNAEVMVATHNQTSVEAAVAGMAALNLPRDKRVYFGQLLGMADHLTFTLGAAGYGAFKYVPFGGVNEVMPYLIRRGMENSDMLGGVGVEMGMLKSELKRRILGGT